MPGLANPGPSSSPVPLCCPRPAAPSALSAGDVPMPGRPMTASLRPNSGRRDACEKARPSQPATPPVYSRETHSRPPGPSGAAPRETTIAYRSVRVPAASRTTESGSRSGHPGVAVGLDDGTAEGETLGAREAEGRADECAVGLVDGTAEERELGRNDGAVVTVGLALGSKADGAVVLVGLTLEVGATVEDVCFVTKLASFVASVCPSLL